MYIQYQVPMHFSLLTTRPQLGVFGKHRQVAEVAGAQQQVALLATDTFEILRH